MGPAVLKQDPRNVFLYEISSKGKNWASQWGRDARRGKKKGVVEQDTLVL